MAKTFQKIFTNDLSIMNKFSDYTSYVEGKIREIDYPGAPFEALYEPIAYSMSAGGKRLRPSLTLMSAEAFGGNPESALNVALGLELFHNFTLLHDDVMDRSATRRGRPSVHAKWDVNTAILSGDTMLTLATQKMTEVPDALLRPVLDAFNKMAIKVYEGQCLDMDFEKRDGVTLEEYLEMITDKTGHLLGAACRIGALIGGATEEQADKMAQFGINLGIAFQIQDDWLDVYGDAATFGKPIGGDINNNKKTYPLLAAYEARTVDSIAIRVAMDLPAGDMKVRTITRLYDRLGISEKVRKVIAHYSSLALAALKSAIHDEEKREPFRLLTEKMTGRRK